MEENADFSATDTIPIPVLDVEKKTLPGKCPWCNTIAGVAKMDVMRIDKISPYYRACGKCQDFINDGKSFPGGTSRLRQWMFSYCRRMCLKDMDTEKNKQ